MLGGASGRMSWCLWHRLERRRYLDADDVRFSKSDELAIAQRYWDDRVTETVTFGELYQSRITSTLSACMEHVFPQWHDGRIMIIGDAAHKVRSAASGAHAKCAKPRFSWIQRRDKELTRRSRRRLRWPTAFAKRSLPANPSPAMAVRESLPRCRPSAWPRYSGFLRTPQNSSSSSRWSRGRWKRSR